MSKTRFMKILGVVAFAGLVGCNQTETEYPSSSTIPDGLDVSEAVPDYTKLHKANPFIALYKDANAWWGENSNETTMQTNLGLLPGADYLVLPTEALAEGVPPGIYFVLIESNSWAMLSADSNVRAADSQAALDQFLQAGGTVIVHAASSVTLPEDSGYVVPGMTGPRSKVDNSGALINGNDLTIVAPASHPFRAGLDGELNTSDDLNDVNIDVTGACCAYEGDLRDALPGNATVLVESADGQPVMAEYTRGLGRVLVTTLTIEFGIDPFYGHDQITRSGYLHYALDMPDNDGDQRPVFFDCDDTDPAIGFRWLDDDFDVNTGYFATTPQLYDRFPEYPWTFDSGVVMTTGPSQQALIGKPETWENVRVEAKLTSLGSFGGCESCNFGDTSRYRAGVLLRTSLNPVADEGFQGYRCALASNVAEIDGIPNSPGPSTGYFLQIASFDNVDFEDDIQSECEGGPNTSFTQLARSEHNIIDIAGGETATITFWAEGNTLYCEARNVAGGPPVTASADLGPDPQFEKGTIGMSTLNMLGVYDRIRACEILPQTP